MTLTLESLARTIAEAQHGTDAYWANYMPAATAVRFVLMKAEREMKNEIADPVVRRLIRE